MAEGKPILIAAISGRALAQSAQRGGYQPLVADFFGDQDTLQAAEDHARFAGALACGIEEDALFNALNVLGARRQPLGIVCGSGFEDRPQLLERIAKSWRLFGNGAAAVAKVKDPEALSAICREAAIPVPEFCLQKPQRPSDWLAKRRGGAGGGHIRPAEQAGRGSVYYQRKVPGVPISALFLADGVSAAVLGFSSQWHLPAADKPFRYGGAVQPATLPSDIAALLTTAVVRLSAAAALVGLNSADFIVDGERFWLLEINPRPGATLDIFEPAQGSLFSLHMAACGGVLPSAPCYSGRARAAAIVYAEDNIPSFPALTWPHWTADRPQPGIAIKAGEPLCTVYACGADATGARGRTEERRGQVLAWATQGDQGDYDNGAGSQRQ
jgi:uncharacterized protein